MISDSIILLNVTVKGLQLCNVLAFAWSLLITGWLSNQTPFTYFNDNFKTKQEQNTTHDISSFVN